METNRHVVFKVMMMIVQWNLQEKKTKDGLKSAPYLIGVI